MHNIDIYKDHMSIHSVKTHSKSTYTVNRMAILYRGVDLQCMSIYSAIRQQRRRQDS